MRLPRRRRSTAIGDVCLVALFGLGASPMRRPVRIASTGAVHRQQRDGSLQFRAERASRRANRCLRACRLATFWALARQQHDTLGMVMDLNVDHVALKTGTNQVVRRQRGAAMLTTARNNVLGLVRRRRQPSKFAQAARLSARFLARRWFGRRRFERRIGRRRTATVARIQPKPRLKFLDFGAQRGRFGQSSHEQPLQLSHPLCQFRCRFHRSLPTAAGLSQRWPQLGADNQTVNFLGVVLGGVNGYRFCLRPFACCVGR